MVSGALEGGPTKKLTKKETSRMYDEKFDILTTQISQVVWAVLRMIPEGGGGGVRLTYIYINIKNFTFYIDI